MRFAVMLLFTCSGLLIRAQVTGMVVGTGYVWRPLTPAYAPGQLATFYVYGLKATVPFRSPVVADRLPLPSSLQGISVAMPSPTGDGEMALPILGLVSGGACNWQDEPGGNCGTLIAVTVQIPYGLPTSTPTFDHGAGIQVRENGTTVASIGFTLFYGQPHIITSHDSISIFDSALRNSGILFPVVRHQDGSLVHEFNPAKPGETLSMWAVGLGYGLGPKAGEPSPEGITSPGLGIRFDFGYMVPPKRPLFVSGQVPTEGLLWAGLVPGQVGVSQINFRVPSEIPADLPACQGGLGGNLTVSIGYNIWWAGRDEFYDGASICVNPRFQPGPVAR
jgi:hypothetical protein